MGTSAWSLRTSRYVATPLQIRFTQAYMKLRCWGADLLLLQVDENGQIVASLEEALAAGR